MSSARLERWIERKFRLRHVELVAELYDSRSILKAARRLISLTRPGRLPGGPGHPRIEAHSRPI